MDYFTYFLFRVCHVFLSVRCSLMATCWKRADPFAILCVMFNCDFVTCPCGVLGQVWCLIVSISDFCLLFSFINNPTKLMGNVSGQILFVYTVACKFEAYLLNKKVYIIQATLRIYTLS